MMMMMMMNWTLESTVNTGFVQTFGPKIPDSFQAFLKQFQIQGYQIHVGLYTVFDAILTSRQPCEKLQRELNVE